MRYAFRWQQDPVGEDTFPHICGALSPGAVTEVLPLDSTAGLSL